MPDPDAKPPQAWGRTGDLVRTFKAVNDPNAPPWSVRFVGAIAAFAILLAAGGAVWYASQAKDDAAGGAQVAAATVEDHGDGTYTDYVGLVPGGAPALVDGKQVEALRAAWDAAHPDATVLKEEPVLSGGQVVGYHVTYRR